VTVFEAVLRRERFVVAACLVALTAVAWLYLLLGAGMSMSGLDMTRLALFPHLDADPMSQMRVEMPSPMLGWAAIFAMWWIMMVAMMTPSAAPLVLLYARVLRHHEAAGNAENARVAHVPSLFLALGYLGVWLVFAAGAATLQTALHDAGLISSMLSSQSGALSVAVLVGAGLYQLSPLKHACLEQCRSPIEFLTRHWRPGRLGAMRIGVRHGFWCVGCCGLLMALLFVGGVMNIVWIAAIAMLVLVEKLAPRGPLVSRAAGIVLVLWGLATITV
jgi:predicted metal-binding membrane protein